MWTSSAHRRRAADPPNARRSTWKDIQISVPKDEDMPPEDKTRRGKVTMFNPDKGFGFIRDLDSGQHFRPRHQHEGAGRVGDKVTFEVEQSLRPSAIKVTIVKSTAISRRSRRRAIGSKVCRRAAHST